MSDGARSEPYKRQTPIVASCGRRVLVATIGNVVTRESSVFPLDDAGQVTSLMHMARVRHAADADLDAEHKRVVAAVQAGTVTLLDPNREPSKDEVDEARGDLLPMAEMVRGDETPDA
jgi:hypothetical protein